MYLLIINICIRIVLILIAATIAGLLTRQTFLDSERVIVALIIMVIILSVFAIFTYIAIEASIADFLNFDIYFKNKIISFIK